MYTTYRLLTVGGALLLAFSAQSLLHSAAQPKDEPQVDVQTRGPIHEAFAQPSAEDPIESPIIKKKPPEPIEELPPEQKPDDDDAQWIPGHWAFDEDRDDFLWVSGVWRSPPPGREWVAGYWQDAGGGYRWVGGFWNVVGATSIELLPPPPQPVEEAVSPQPNVDTTYVPGVWVYRQDRYLWRPGHWIACRPGWMWAPAHYCWTPGGYIFVNGFWDYNLHRRGICFAPVYFSGPVYGQPGWAYRPRYAIGADFLLTSLFVYAGTNRYYFGDYYDQSYARRGYAPWVDYRVRGNYYDPLYNQYRWQNRNDNRWEQDLRATYVARRDNQAARPPRTLAQQQKVAAANTNLLVATPIEQFKPKEFKLQTVSKTQLEVIRKHTESIKIVSKERVKIETQTKVGKSPGKITQPTAPVKIELPKSAFRQPETKQKPPPPPDVPKELPKAPPPPKKKDVSKETPKLPPVKKDDKELPKVKKDDKELPKPPPVKKDDGKELPKPPKKKDVPKDKDKDKKSKDPDDKKAGDPHADVRTIRIGPDLRIERLLGEPSPVRGRLRLT